MREFFVVFLSTLMVVAPMPMMGAETPKTTKQSTFSTQEACEAALAKKDFAYYVPVFTGDKGKNPIDDKEIFGVKLEADMCRLQVTMKGEKWVVQKEGTLMRARKGEDGEFVIFARNDCGNKDATPAPEPVVSTPPPVVEEPKPVTPLVEIPSIIVPPPLPAVGMTKKPSRTVWYVVGGIILAGGIVALAGGGGKSSSKPNGGQTGPAF